MSSQKVWRSQEQMTRMNYFIASTFVGGAGLFYMSISYSNLKYDIEPMKGIPYDSGLAEFTGESSSSSSSSSSSTTTTTSSSTTTSSASSSPSSSISEYHVMRMFSSKTNAIQPSMTVSAMAVGWVYSTPEWARLLTGFETGGGAHVLKEGETVGQFTVKKKSIDSVVFEKTGDDYDTLVGLDLIKCSASETRDKYYACLGFQTTPKTSYGDFHVRFIAPFHTMAYKVMLKYSGRYAQDLYAHKYGAGPGNLQRSPIIDAVAQKQAVKAFHKGKADDMGEAEAGRR